MTDAATVDQRETLPAQPADGRPRRRLGAVLKLVATILIIGGIGYYLVGNWAGVKDAWQRLSWSTLVLSTLAALAGLAASSMGWRDAARDIGCQVTFPAAARVFMIGQLGKYVPGSVWAFVLQTELGRRAGVPRARAFLASMTAMGIGIAAALVVGVAAVPSMIDPPDSGSAYAGSVRIGLIIMVVLFPVALFCSVPRVLTYLVSTALRLLRRPPLDKPLTWGGVLRMFGWNIVAWLCFGAHLWLLVDANGDPGAGGFLRCVGAFAIALSVGMFWPAPSGIGAREIILFVTLAPFLGGDQPEQVATGIVVASRLVFLITEVIGAGLAALTDIDALRRGGRTEAA